MIDRTLLHRQFCRALGLPVDTSQTRISRALEVSQPRYAQILGAKCSLGTLAEHLERAGALETAELVRQLDQDLRDACRPGGEHRAAIDGQINDHLATST